MSKLFLIALALALTGCAEKVYVNKDGRMRTDNVELTDAELPSFARELNTKKITVVPENNPDFATVVKARDKLRDAGAQDIEIDLSAK